MALEATVICIYGPSGVGKTTDAGYSFPNALFFAAPGALNSVRSVCGYTPQQIQVATIEEATELLPSVKKEGFDEVVIDDFSFMAEQSFSNLENVKKKKGFDLWGAMRNTALEFRDKSRYTEIKVVLNAWEQPPKINAKGAAVKGGPMLSGRLPEQLPALCDMVLRACYEPKRKPWPVVYRCYPDPSYAMKDRFDIANRCDPAPMNLGEILRAAGFTIRRHKDLPQQEADVEAIAATLSGDSVSDVAVANAAYSILLSKGNTPEAARWTLRDAMDRAVIRRSLSAARDVFISSTSSLL